MLELRKLSSIAFVLPTDNKQRVWDSVAWKAPKNTPEIERLRQLDVSHLMIVCFKSPDTLAWALLMLLEGAAAMSAVQPAEVVARQARAAAKSLLASHHQANA